MPKLNIKDNVLKISSGTDYIEIHDECVCMNSEACYPRMEGEGISLVTSHDSMVLTVGRMKFIITPFGILKNF
jgi:hypothetical protein